MKAIVDMSYNELRAEAKRLGIVLKNGKKEEYISLIKEELEKSNEVKLVELGTISVGQQFRFPKGKSVYVIADLPSKDEGKVAIKGLNTKGWFEKKSYKVELV